MAAGAVETSDLWGVSGEKWTPQSRLPDFSFAGYHCGETPLPALPPVAVTVSAMAAPAATDWLGG